MRSGFAFEILASDGEARLGRLTTPHGAIETPAFMPVGTYGAVRGVDGDDLAALGAQILLANAYHLHERPGEAIVASAGGLRGFSGWRGPWLTDSGGFQITSLADRVRVSEDGVAFVSALDGSRRLLTPELAVAIQEALGADIAMVLDECRPPLASETAREDDEHRSRAAAARTLRWAERCRDAHTRPDQSLFAIVQGGARADLRRETAASLASMGFDGYAHGGLGLGESPAARVELVHESQQELPREAPRYLMGLGKPEDLVLGVMAGVDLFDCVIPTRHARHGVLFSDQGVIKLRNARFRDDLAPIEAGCDCPTCARHSRAYLRHLLQVNEILGSRLATLHNLRFYLRLLERARVAIRERRLPALLSELREAGAQ
jgi:queuine tRNA-ribosyltransferase